jgi:hypothetical protein
MNPNATIQPLFAKSKSQIKRERAALHNEIFVESKEIERVRAMHDFHHLINNDLAVKNEPHAEGKFLGNIHDLVKITGETSQTGRNETMALYPNATESKDVE